MNTYNPDGREKRYVLLGHIGTGERAEIYRCRLEGPKGFEKLVALKKLLPQWASDAAAVADFLDEVRLAALFNHENIAQIYDFVEIDGGYFLIMEYLAGKDLAAVMQRTAAVPGGMPAAIALYVAAKICTGLEYAHSAKDLRQSPLNLIHRELSPDNIFITYDGRVKIMDFGCARADFLEDRMRMGMMKGKVAYMSPEQLAAVNIDQRADIFAVGIILYEMLSGRRLYSGEPEEMIPKCKKAEYERIENVARKLPAAACAIVDRALQSDRNLRYQSCGQMLADIETCLAAIQPRPGSQLLGKYLRGLFAPELPEDKKRPVRLVPLVDEEHGEKQRHLVAVGTGTGQAVSSPDRVRRFRRSAWFSAGGIIVVLVFFLMASEIAEEDEMAETPLESPLRMVLDLSQSAGLEPSAAPEAPDPIVSPRTVSGDLAAKPSPVPPGKRDFDAERAKNIESLLAQAGKAWKEKRLTDPEKDCAFWFYSRILALDPKNADAWQGIDRINNYYGTQAEKALAEQRFQEADRYLQKGLQVFPENRRLVALQEGMEARKRQYVVELVGKAERALRRDNLTTPAETCAYTYYKKILKLDKRNEAALDGIDRIADRYAELAEDAYRNLQLANCREFVRSGLSVAPHHPKLLQLKEDLDRSMPGIFFKSLEKSFRTMFE